MKKYFLSLLACFPLLVHGQENISQISGIKFEKYSDWQGVLTAAKAANKYIFVDAYTTWCAPCKQMDREVYSVDKIGALLNDKFISIKVQMDTTSQDDEYTKKWYRDAALLEASYKVSVFPSYLFLSSDGKLLHKETGYKPVAEFAQLISQASDPSRQYYALVEEYRQGKKNYTSMIDLAIAARKLIGPALADSIAADYKINYLDSLSNEALLKAGGANFIIGFSHLVSSSQDKLFGLLYYHGNRIDSIVGYRGIPKGFSNNIVSGIIEREEVDQKLWQDDKPVTKQPNWNELEATITKKYNKAYANRILPDAKLLFYKRVGNWPEFARLKDERIADVPIRATPKGGGYNLFDPDGTWMLNVDAWDVFLRCDDKHVLGKALKWVELAIELEEPAPNVQYLDTKANILYKLGRVQEAIALEKKALQEVTVNKSTPLIREFTDILAKMEKAEPTWETR